MRVPISSSHCSGTWVGRNEWQSSDPCLQNRFRKMCRNGFANGRIRVILPVVKSAPTPSAKRATISDVAKLAGVAKGTVSSVLNGQSRTARISEETERRVLRAADDLRYKPNALARMLVRQRTETLAVVFQRGYFFTSWSSFTAEVMRGVSTAAVELGYDLMLHTKDVDCDREAETLADGRVDGVLILRDEDDPIVRELMRQEFPCVRFFSRGTDGAPFVDVDNVSGGQMATQHLIELGHSRIGIIHGPEHSTASTDRLAGYHRAMAQSGLEVQPDWELEIHSPMSSFGAFHALMRSEKPPTAIFVWSDDVALACISALHELGMSVPSNVSVVGFDSLEVCERSVPPLTSVRQPVMEMAHRATRILVEIIRGQEVAERQVLMPLLLDVRASTAPCPPSHSL